MKSSYKFYGVFWDNKTIPNKAVNISEWKDDLRKDDGIVLSEVLKSESPKEYSDCGENKNYILIDFVPTTESNVILRFYARRLLQIIEYYQVDEIYCKGKEISERLQEVIDYFYKEKTPNKLLAQSDGAFQMIC